MITRTIALAAVAGLLASPALADGLKPAHAQRIDLPGHVGTAYYTVEASNYLVVATLGDRGNEGDGAVMHATALPVALTVAAIGMVLAVTAGAFSADQVPAGSLPICAAGKRVTCIVDGDTGWLNGEKWRLAGTDTPETFQPECTSERRQGKMATMRLRSLMAGGYSIERDGKDRYGRTLVAITLADGRDAGEVLIAEGLAQPWPNRGNVWCGR